MSNSSEECSSSTTSPLLRPLMLRCGITLPNRLIKAAMTEALADNHGRPTSQLCDLYSCWAQDCGKGGVGVLLTGNIQIDRRYVELPGNVCIDKFDPQYENKESMELLRHFAQAGRIKQSGSVSLIMAQIAHAGRQSNGMINMNPVGPGNIGLEDMPLIGKVSFGTPRPLEQKEIEEDIIERFVYAATMCQEAGFDGVQLHAAHGYLFSAFLNPRANNRPELFGEDDPYGGSLENRSRLLLTVVRRVKEATSTKDDKDKQPFAVSVKLNTADFQKGGFTTEEAAQVAQWLEQEGIDFLELSGGNYETGAFYVMTMQDKQEKKKKASTIQREAFFMEYALQIQETLTATPIMVTGGWRTRMAMETAIDRGDCALIGLARPMCGVPACGAQLLAGQIDQLPSYETSLPEDDRLTNVCSAICCCCRSSKIGGMLQMLGLQGWFYRNIFQIATEGQADPSLGVWSSMIANMKHETKLAKELQGVDCKGQIYKGL